MLIKISQKVKSKPQFQKKKSFSLPVLREFVVILNGKLFLRIFRFFRIFQVRLIFIGVFGTERLSRLG